MNSHHFLVQIDATQLMLTGNSIALPIQSSNVSFVGILEDGIGALHLVSNNMLYLVYPDCPIGYSRDVTATGLCQKCPLGSLVLPPLYFFCASPS